METTIKWEEVTDKVKAFSLKGKELEAKIVAVYDGDTCKACFPVFNEMFKWTMRLNRIDTPELKTKNVLESSFGYEVRDKIREKILNKVVKLKCGEFDKYGRLLAEVYINGESINQFLIDNKYAFEYDGGTKKLWEQYLKDSGYVFKEHNVVDTVVKSEAKKTKKKKNAENIDENMVAKKTKRAEPKSQKVKETKVIEVKEVKDVKKKSKKKKDSDSEEPWSEYVDSLASELNDEDY